MKEESLEDRVHKYEEETRCSLGLRRRILGKILSLPLLSPSLFRSSSLTEETRQPVRTQGNQRRQSDTRGRSLNQNGERERRARSGETDHMYRSRSQMERARDRDQDRERERARSADAVRGGLGGVGQRGYERRGVASGSDGFCLPCPCCLCCGIM
jgi:hypothetical protein